MDNGRRSEGGGLAANGPPASPTTASSSTPKSIRANAPPKSTLLAKAGALGGESFAREAECSGCLKSFNILSRRRHHCRGCHVAICKDCGRKAIDKRKGEDSKPQWFCLACLEDDAMLEVAGNRAPLSKRLSFSSTSVGGNNGTSAPPMAKFCIECGNELPPRVKFCIECGTQVRPMMASSPSGGDRRSDTGVFPSRLSRSGSAGKALGSIEEHQEHHHSPASEDAVETELEAAAAEDDNDERNDQRDHSTDEGGAGASSVSNEQLQLLAQLQEENEKLKRRVEKMKAKVVDAEEKRVRAERRAEEAQRVSQACSNEAVTPQSGAEGSTSAANKGEGTAAKDHPDYAKFFKLQSMGLPAEQVKMKMTQAGVDPSILDDPDRILGGGSSASGGEQPSNGVKVKDDEKYAKFFKLAKMGMPTEQIKMKMSAEGLNPDLLDTPDAVMPGTGGPPDNDSGVAGTTVKEDPAYEKFFKLLKMGMPAEQIKLKMSASGLNPDLLDTPDAPSPHQATGPQKPIEGSKGGLLGGLPPHAEAVKVDASALKASLASKLQKSDSTKEKPAPQLPKKEAIKPNVELRPLFWTRVPVNVVSNTMWMKLNDSKPDLDLSEMEWMFRKNPVDLKKQDEEKSKKKDGKDTQPQQVLLLDPKRQQNVSIAIARFKMSASDMKDAIYALDTEKISAEVLNVLISIAPTVEEQDLLKNYDGDENLLGNVEKFFLELLSIPRYTQRIKCMRFKMQFENRILETQAQLDTLTAATDQVSDNEKLYHVLEHILAIGNYLNGSTPRGGAYGFRLDTLTKLHTLKSVDPRVNLMHFLARQLEENAPDLVDFAGLMPHIGEAKRLSLDHLRADIKSYNTELSMLQGQVRASKNDDIPGDKFYEEMAPFAKDAAEVLDELARDLSSLESSYSELLSSYGEDPRKVGPIEFFSIMEEFVNEFKKAYRQNQSKEFQTLWDGAKQAREDAEAAAKAAAEAEEAERLRKEEEDRAAAELAQAGVTEDTKGLYTAVISTVSTWAQNHGVEEPNIVVDRFKSITRRFGIDELSADEFCEEVRRCVGSKTAIRLIPDSAKLLQSASKRKDLLLAFDRFTEQVKREKEERKKQRDSLTATNDSGAAVPKPRRKKVSAIRVEDIEPVVGEAAQQLHKSILEQVHQAFGGDQKKMKTFTTNARKYGSEQISAREFYQYLTASFDPDFVGRLVPDLARLLQDAEKRHALIIALCESAAGWEKFSGL